MDNMETVVKPKRKVMSRKIRLTDADFTDAVPAEQRQHLIAEAKDVALVAQRIIDVQKVSEARPSLKIGGVNRVGSELIVDLLASEDSPAVRLTHKYGWFSVKTRNFDIMEGKSRGGDRREHISDGPTKFKYYDRLKNASIKSVSVMVDIVGMWGNLHSMAGLHNKTKARISVEPDVLMYIDRMRSDSSAVPDDFVERKFAACVVEARERHKEREETLGNITDFMHKPVWFVEPLPDVGVRACQVRLQSHDISDNKVVVDIVKPPVYAASLDVLPDEYRLPTMVRLKMLKASLESDTSYHGGKALGIMPLKDHYYDNLGVFTYSKSFHSYRAPLCVLFA
jgi:hypothetical protein